MKETKQGRPEKFKGGSKIRPFRVPLSEPYQTETITKIKKVLDEVAMEMQGESVELIEFSINDMLESYEKGARYGSTTLGNDYYFEQIIEKIKTNKAKQ